MVKVRSSPPPIALQQRRDERGVDAAGEEHPDGTSETMR
jgi:hypothetical protein